VSDRRRRRENIVTGLLASGICIVIAGTVIFASKFANGSGDFGIQTGTTGTDTSGNSSENTTVTTAAAASESTSESTSASTSESTSESTTESAAASTTIKPEISVTPSPESYDESTSSSEETSGEEYSFILSSEEDKLSGIKDLKAGTVVSKDRIDKDNLSKYFTSSKIEEGDSVYERINGKSYKSNKDIKLSDLRYLKMLHVNFDGEYQVGEMIVNKSVADEVLGIFKSLFSDGYQIYSMYLIDNFWEKNAGTADWNSIEANNTSCFCYRAATGGSKLSKHALGRAIDINPQQNPYVTFKDGKPSYSHKNAADYASNRSSKKAHVITTSDKAYKLFTKKGWTWGGSWSSPKDYQHFQK
jgi:hypothetical protein